MGDEGDGDEEVGLVAGTRRSERASEAMVVVGRRAGRRVGSSGMLRCYKSWARQERERGDGVIYVGGATVNA